MWPPRQARGIQVRHGLPHEQTSFLILDTSAKTYAIQTSGLSSKPTECCSVVAISASSQRRCYSDKIQSSYNRSFRRTPRLC